METSKITYSSFQSTCNLYSEIQSNPRTHKPARTHYHTSTHIYFHNTLFGTERQTWQNPLTETDIHGDLITISSAIDRRARARARTHTHTHTHTHTPHSHMRARATNNNQNQPSVVENAQAQEQAYHYVLKIF